MHSGLYFSNISKVAYLGTTNPGFLKLAHKKLKKVIKNSPKEIIANSIENLGNKNIKTAAYLAKKQER